MAQQAQQAPQPNWNYQRGTLVYGWDDSDNLYIIIYAAPSPDFKPAGHPKRALFCLGH